MATKCHGLKLKEIFNNCLPGGRRLKSLSFSRATSGVAEF
jgi:hypothetical protein